MYNEMYKSTNNIAAFALNRHPMLSSNSPIVPPLHQSVAAGTETYTVEEPATVLTPTSKLDENMIIEDTPTIAVVFEPEVEKKILVKLQSNDSDDVTCALSEDRSESLAAVLEVDDSLSQRPLHTKPTVCGHRGAIYKSLENTRHSIQVAYELGCEEVEIDVFLLKCGELIVFHGYGTDEDPGRFENYCRNMKGSILDYTYEELKDYRFNPDFDEFGCGPDVIRKLESDGLCYIPKLEEVLLDAKKYGIVIKIELKGPETAEPTLELVEDLDMVNQVHFSSFELSRIQTIRELRPQRCSVTGKHIYKTGALFDTIPDDFVQVSLDMGASEVHLCYNACSKSRVDAIHRAGMDSMCWFRGPIGMKSDVTTRFHDVGNEDINMFHTVMATGVRKLCVNKPDVLLEAIKCIHS